MRVACSQFSPRLFGVDDNKNNILKYMEEASDNDVDLIVFPECSLTGYVFESPEDFAKIDCISVADALNAISKEAENLSINVVFGTLEIIDGVWVNSCYLIDKYGRCERQVKNHLPKIGADRFVREGDAAARVFQIGDFRVGIIICYEARFPEISRSLALEGVDILLHPTNLPISSKKIVDFILPVRAMENKVYVISSNRTGEENGVKFLGRSTIFDLNGDILAEADQLSSGLIYANLSIEAVRNKTLNFSSSAPHSGISDIYLDRRPNLYSNKLNG